MIEDGHTEVNASAKTSEPWTEKLSREAELLKSAGPGFINAAKDATKPENLPATLGTVALSAGLGLVMARYAPMKGAVGALTRTGLASMTIAGLAETTVNGSQIAGALKDTWNSDRNWQQNVSVVRSSLGRFAFESALMTAGGLTTSKLSSATFRTREYLSCTKKLGLSGDAVTLDLAHPQYAFKEPATLRLMQNRLTGYKTRQEVFVTRNENELGPFADFTDYKKRALTEITAPVREYTVKGLETKIDVPEEYAQSLDQVRALRLKAEGPSGLRGFFSRGKESQEALLKLDQHPHGYRALPEDLIELLERQPNASYTRRLLISDWEWPLAAFYSKSRKALDATPASASPSGFIATHKLAATDADGGYLNLIMNHEWSHLSKWRNKTASDAFDAAVGLEDKNYLKRHSPLSNLDEHWAIYSAEGVLTPSGSQFVEMVRTAPMRSAVLGRSLTESLAQVPAHNRSPLHNFYAKRAAYIQENVTPKVLAELDQKMQSPEQIELAKKVKGYLTQRKPISNESAADQIEVFQVA